jgi:polar amino acid transport system substrate-binding protein
MLRVPSLGGHLRFGLGALFGAVAAAAVVWATAGTAPAHSSGIALRAGADYVQSPTLQRIVKSGTLRACVDPEFPPEVYTKNGQPAGFDPDLTKLVAAGLGVKVQWVQSSFDGLIAGLQSGKCDFALSGVTPRGKRALSVTFAKPTLAAAELVVVKASETRSTIAALNNKAVRFCDQAGTGSQTDQERYFPNTKRVLVPSASDCLLQLLSGKADAVISDSITGNGWLKAHRSQLKLVAENAGLPGAPVGAAVPLGDIGFATYLNVFFGEWINNGGYQPLFEKDMGYAPNMDELFRQRGNF